MNGGENCTKGYLQECTPNVDCCSHGLFCNKQYLDSDSKLNDIEYITRDYCRKLSAASGDHLPFILLVKYLWLLENHVAHYCERS